MNVPTTTREVIADNVISLRHLRRMLDANHIEIHNAGLSARATAAHDALAVTQELNMRASMADHAGNEHKARRALPEIDRRLSDLSFDVREIVEHATRTAERNARIAQDAIAARA